MKQIEYFILVLLFILLSYSNINSQNNKDNLQIKLLLNKSEYLVGEDIMLTIRMKNFSKDTIFLTLFNENYLYESLQIFNDSGKGLHFHGLGISLVDDGKGNLYPIKPDEEQVFKEEILQDFGTIKQKNDLFGIVTPYFLRNGRYKIFLNTDIKEFNRILKSDTAEFDIKEPENDENEACTFMQFIDSLLNKNLKNEKYEEFFNLFPNSMYLDQIFKHYLGDLGYIGKWNISTVDKCKWFIGQKPNSIYADPILNAMIKTEETFNQENPRTKEILEEIISKYPGTEFSKYAKIYLDNHK